jgi:cytoskeletal protein CcmA (bactofilin family)
MKVMNGDKNGQSSGKRTVIEEGSAISGNLSSSCPIVVLGKIEGEISGPSMEIAESGAVSGRIKVAAVSSRGELAGQLEAETVELSGRVRDETVIRARSLVTSTTGTPVKFGECELSIGDQPDKQRAIDQATGVARKGDAPAAVAPATPTVARRRRNTGAVEVALDKDAGSVPH